MNKYVKRASLLMLWTLFVLTLSAQQQRQRPSAQDRAQQETQMMKNLLNPSEDLLCKIDSVNVHYAKKMDEVMRNGRREESRDDLRTLAEEKDAAIKVILSDEQYAKYKEDQRRRMSQQQRQRSQMQRSERPPTQHSERPPTQHSERLYGHNSERAEKGGKIEMHKKLHRHLSQQRHGKLESRNQEKTTYVKQIS